MSQMSLIIIYWTARIIHLFDLIIIIGFIYLEYSYIKSNRIQKVTWSQTFLFLTMLSCILGAIARGGTYVPNVCVYTLEFVVCFHVMKNIFLTFFQIRRLRNTFSSESLNTAHFLKYGYRKRIFVILYIFGLLMLMALPCSFLFLSSMKNIPGFGCVSSGIFNLFL